MYLLRRLHYPNQPYISQGWHQVLRENKLLNFNDIWQLEKDWFEDPNKRRGGWGGVIRREVVLPDGSVKGLYIKRQQNHTIHRYVGILTLEREFKNILYYKKLGIPTCHPVFFQQRIANGNIQGILITEELAGYQSLENLLARWQQQGYPNGLQQEKIMARLAEAIFLLHKNCLVHNSLYSKHIFLRLCDTEAVEVCFIDLEKSYYQPFTLSGIIRDLEMLNRHTAYLSHQCRQKFLQLYLKASIPAHKHKLFLQKFNRRSKRKTHNSAELFC